MEVTIVEVIEETDEDEGMSKAYIDGYIEINSSDAVRFEQAFDALIKRYAR